MLQPYLAFVMRLQHFKEEKSTSPRLNIFGPVAYVAQHPQLRVDT